MSIQTLPRTPAGWIDLARSGPQPGQTPSVVIAVYRLWLVAFALKMLGSTWDMSWHFKWLRDDLAPPHLLNTIGTVIVVALVIFQVRYNVGVDKLAKQLLVFGTAMFLIAIPIDVLNHRINGLDITAWSASHALLYLGTAFMLLGCVRGYWISTPAGRTRTVVSGLIWGFFLENVLFPSQHQEYGTLSLAAWRAGRPTAEPILLQFAATQLGRPVDDIAISGFSLPVASWVYPAWMAGAALLTLVAARRFVGARWTATAVAAGYLAYRAVVWGILVGTGFPPSLPPFFLLAGAIVIDLVFLASAATPAIKASALVTPPAWAASRTSAASVASSTSATPSAAATTPTSVAPSTSVASSWSTSPGSASPAMAALAMASRATGVVAALFGAALATGAIAASTWMQHIAPGTPPINYLGFVYGGAALAIGWAVLVFTPNRAAS